MCLNSGSSAVKKLEQSREPPDRHKVLIIVGDNVGILLVAGVISLVLAFALPIINF